MNKIVTISLLLFLMIPLNTYAHTTLLSSNPMEGEFLKTAPEQLELVFGTVIEEGSTMKLEGPNQSYEMSNISIEETTMTGSIEEELPNGAYIIYWNIIGEDGHPIEGQILFSLDAETAAEEAPDESKTPEEEPIAEAAASDQPAESTEAAESAEDSQGGVISTVLLTAAVILIGFVLYKLLQKKA